MDKKHQPLSLAQLRQLRTPLRNVNTERKKQLSRVDRLALFITQEVGSMGFFFIVLTWTGAWLLWNTFAPQELRFDPFPAFVLWLFISNVIQLMLLPLLMVGQNLQGRHDEARAQADFEVNTRAEREIETILAHLENQQKLLEDINNRLEKKQSHN